MRSSTVPTASITPWRWSSAATCSYSSIASAKSFSWRSRSATFSRLPVLVGSSVAILRSSSSAFALLALAVVAVRGRLQGGDRLGGEAHALVELGERLEGIEALGREVLDLLEDGDGARVEAFLGVLVGDLGVGRDRLVDLAPTPIGVADLETQLRVLGIEAEELLVLLEGPVLRALLGVLAGRLQDLALVRGQPAPLGL